MLNVLFLLGNLSGLPNVLKGRKTWCGLRERHKHPFWAAVVTSQKVG